MITPKRPNFLARGYLKNQYRARFARARAPVAKKYGVPPGGFLTPVPRVKCKRPKYPSTFEIAPSNTRNHISTPGITLQHSKSHFNIRNRTATLEITFQHSKSPFNTQNYTSTFEIAFQHSKSPFTTQNHTSAFAYTEK